MLLQIKIVILLVIVNRCEILITHSNLLVTKTITKYSPSLVNNLIITQLGSSSVTDCRL